ncbi:IS3 family transposase [Flavobacterium sp.]|uniref:IS3 family transposase n=1 Tax=Flavobacterium sp. TaxID=239 RepID=UPI0032656764
MKENKNSYSHDLKMKAVMLSFEKGTIAEVAQKFNITSHSLFNWRKNFIIHGPESFSDYGKGKLSTDDKKIFDLKIKIKKLNTQFEIIKGAADYLQNKSLSTFQYITENEDKYSSYLMCKTLGVNLGSYNKWKYEYVSERQKWKITVKEEITRIFIASKKRYGSRRITAELQKSGYQLSSNTVLIYMRELNLYVSVKKNKTRT